MYEVTALTVLFSHKTTIFFLQSFLHWPILKTAPYSWIFLRRLRSTENKQRKSLRCTKRRMVTLPLSEWTKWRELAEAWVSTTVQLESESPGSNLAGTYSLALTLSPLATLGHMIFINIIVNLQVTFNIIVVSSVHKFKKIHAPLDSLQPYLQQKRYGSNLSAYW